MTREFWENRYTEASRSGSTIWSLDPNLWLADVTGPLTPGTAVDLGAGEGRNALWLASLGWTVVAVDFSPAGLAIGRSRAESIGVGDSVDWVEADATDWVSAHPVDLVVMAYLQLPQDALARVIRNAADSLAAGGTLALIGHDRSNLTGGYGGPQDAALLSTPEELRRAAAAAGLIVETAALYDRVTPDGHVAIDSTLIARKPSTRPPADGG